jgi:predicted ATPase/transcriptional regulator with XRE-family HTH domain
METLYSFGEWLRLRRSTLGLTRAELADCAGCSISALRKIEADDRRPSRELAELMATCLRISPEEHAQFLDAARGVRSVDRLGLPSSEVNPLPMRPPALPLSPGLSPRQPPPRPQWNLPVPATPLVGREVEMNTLGQLLGDPLCRLLTLVGPGGIGKTRLALEMACLQWERFAGNVFFAPLASVASADHLVLAIAQAVQFTFSGPTDPRSQLISYLSDKEIFLLLDNLEHLLDGVDLVVEMLEKSPHLRLLATSRERLELQVEWVFEVQGLPVPAGEQDEGLESYSAVQLFLQRARQARVDFQLSEADELHLARICRIAEGMPLAIELAAAWAPILPCREIADEIERGIDFLAATRRDVPGRHLSVRASFDHSWRLLSPEEQGVLRRLAIFQAGFTREAAERVARATLVILSQLVSKSLVQRSTSKRYVLHELLRQYSLEQLTPAERSAAHRDHADYIATLVREAEPHFTDAEQIVWLDRLEQELGNIRAVLAWALESGEREVGLQIASDLAALWSQRDLHSEGIHWLTVLLERAGDNHPSLFNAQATTGFLAYERGDFTTARRWLEAALPHLDTKPELRQADTLLAYWGSLFLAQGDYASAHSYLDRALAAVQQSRPYSTMHATILIWQADVLRLQGDTMQALHLYATSISILRQTGNKNHLAYALRHSSWAQIERKELPIAAALCRESMLLNQETDSEIGLIACFACWAAIWTHCGRSAQAAQLLGAVGGMLRRLDLQLRPLDQVEYKAAVATLQKELDPQIYGEMYRLGESCSQEQILALVVEFNAH